MSLAIKYEGAEDARMRLKGTVVLYKEMPVLVRDVQRGDGDDILRVLFEELPLKPRRPFEDIEEDGNAKRKYISSKHFDIAPFRLGYVNRPDGQGAFYCERTPNRIQKQGLCAENFKGSTNNGIHIPFPTFTTCRETVAMINNNYPDFHTALRQLGKVPSIAFSREFCLQQDEVFPSLIYVYHKGNKVAFYTDGKVTLGDKFKCLRESLEELKVKVG